MSYNVNEYAGVCECCGQTFIIAANGWSCLPTWCPACKQTAVYQYPRYTDLVNFHLVDYGDVRDKNPNYLQYLMDAHFWQEKKKFANIEYEHDNLYKAIGTGHGHYDKQKAKRVRVQSIVSPGLRSGLFKPYNNKKDINK